MKYFKDFYRFVNVAFALWCASLAASAQTVTFFHNDVSGSPIMATNASGSVLWKENYSPYGDKINRAPASADNKIGFHGKPHDDATGLSYMGARYYAPSLGRFTGIDPIDFQENNPHSFNRYAYANNNPYKYVDPDGKLPVLALIPLALKIADIAITAHAIHGAYQGTGIIGAAKELGSSMASNAIPGLKTAKHAGEIASTGKGFKSLLPSVPKGPGSVPPAERDPIRFYTPPVREAKRAEQGYKCANGCGTTINKENSAGHHIQRHADGGKTDNANHAEVCVTCHNIIHNKGVNE